MAKALKEVNIVMRHKIRKLYTKDGYTRQELLIMYKDYDWRQILQAIKYLKRPERI